MCFTELFNELYAVGFQCHRSVLTKLTSAHWKAPAKSSSNVCAELSYAQPAVNLYEIGMKYGDIVKDSLGMHECIVLKYIDIIECKTRSIY